MALRGLPLHSLIYRCARYIGLDRAVMFGTLSRGWTLAAGPVTMLLIVWRFSQEVQGYYYTFNSLLAMTVFLELGLTIVIQQFASHEWAQLEMDEGGWITGDARALSRLAGLSRISFRWYALAGILAVIGTSLAGYVFFSRKALVAVHWTGPWLALCLMAGATLAFVPVWALLDGCNQIRATYRARFVQNVLTSVTAWVAILFGAGLWAAPLMMLVGIGTALVLLCREYKHFFQSLKTASRERISWRDEIWPMQWKISLSWLSGYFIFSLFTPVLFQVQGPVSAGQMGMTWSLINALLGIALTWMTTKGPTFGMLIARQEYAALDRLFRESTIQMLMVGIIGAGLVWTGVYGLNIMYPRLARRFLDPTTTGLLLGATIVHMFVAAMAVYLRAHKQEPYLIPSVLSAVAIGFSTFFLGSRFGATGMAVGYFVLALLFLIPEVTIFFRCRRVWHGSQLACKILQS